MRSYGHACITLVSRRRALGRMCSANWRKHWCARTTLGHISWRPRVYLAAQSDTARCARMRWICIPIRLEMKRIIPSRHVRREYDHAMIATRSIGHCMCRKDLCTHEPRRGRRRKIWDRAEFSRQAQSRVSSIARHWVHRYLGADSFR